MKIRKKQQARQLEARDNFINIVNKYDEGGGAFNHFTGTGKTYTSCLTIKKYLEINPFDKVIVLVPNVVIKLQFEQTLKNKVTIKTRDEIVNSPVKEECSLLVVDELHEYYTDKRIKAINKTLIKYNYILGLTATYFDSNNYYKNVESFCPIIDTIDEEEALDKNFISPFIEYNIGLKLTESEKKEYENLSKKVSNGMQFFQGKLQIAYSCVSGKMVNGVKRTGKEYSREYARYRVSKNSNPKYFTEKSVFLNALNLTRAIRDRKHLLYSSTNKLKTSFDILDKYQNEYVILFSEDTKFSDAVYELIEKKHPNNAVVYHSQLKPQMLPSEKTGKIIKYGSKRLKDRAVNRIKLGKSKHLITASSFDKGLDIPILKIALTCSGTSNVSKYIQRSGRVKRKDKNKKVSYVINLYIKNSQEEKWLQKRQIESSHFIKEIDNLNELKIN